MPYNYKTTSQERDQIRQWALEGETYSSIAKKLGNKITRQRVKQICTKENIDSKSIRMTKNSKEQEAKMTAKWGKDWANPSVRRSYLYQAMRTKYNAKKNNAKRLGYFFNINFGDIDFPTHCPILGIELDYFTEDGWKDNSPSFDRIDPTKDYVKNNVAVISMRANRIKNNGTAEEHEKIAEFMKKHITQ